MAQESGRPLDEVASDPYALTLYHYLLILDRERIATARAQGERLDLAGLIHHALLQPERLMQIDSAHRAKLGLLHVELVDARARAVERLARYRTMEVQVTRRVAHSARGAKELPTT